MYKNVCLSALYNLVVNTLWYALLQNHIAHTASRLSSQLSLYQQALSHSSQLLSESSETVNQQGQFVKEYLQLYQVLS